jgi:hypothetical protein
MEERGVIEQEKLLLLDTRDCLIRKWVHLLQTSDAVVDAAIQLLVDHGIRARTEDVVTRFHDQSVT